MTLSDILNNMVKIKYKLSDFYFDLPEGSIAQEPIKPRDHSRLLVLHKDDGNTEHCNFFDLENILKPGDVLVMNDSMVFPARLVGKKIPGGGRLEVFLLKGPTEQICRKNVWTCLVGGRKTLGQMVEFEKGLIGKLFNDNLDGTWLVEFNYRGKKFMATLEEIGRVPLPPYIKRKGKTHNDTDPVNYQTIYADEKKKGSVAAPTAGLHFTERLIRKLKEKGVHFEFVTLHVGLGTFAAVKSENIAGHKMHEEWVEIRKGVLERIVRAKMEGRRVIAVGTTSARTLEAVFNKLDDGILGKQTFTFDKNKVETKKSKNIIFKSYSGWVDIFIYPGYEFKIIDGMITNFHLPKSTLLMLVSALAGKDNIDKAYKTAISKKYRFYSYGDAMLII
jgi:S-adenosylmethionine:tRNA ribosyltransferase-isomerase